MLVAVAASLRAWGMNLQRPVHCCFLPLPAVSLLQWGYLPWQALLVEAGSAQPRSDPGGLGHRCCDQAALLDCEEQWVACSTNLVNAGANWWAIRSASRRAPQPWGIPGCACMLYTWETLVSMQGSSARWNIGVSSTDRHATVDVHCRLVQVLGWWWLHQDSPWRQWV